MEEAPTNHPAVGSVKYKAQTVIPTVAVVNSAN